MSTKNSLELFEWKTNHSIHVYKEMMDDCYYVETDDGKIKVPGDIAKKFAKVLTEEKPQGLGTLH